MKYRQPGKIKNTCLQKNQGFTLVELVVVLVLMAILLSLTIFGGLAWQDYSRFKHENSVAEDLFFAAQNQLTELEAGGTLEQLVIRPLKEGASSTNGNGYNTDSVKVLAYSDDEGNITQSQLISIYDENNSAYEWNSIWKNMQTVAGAMNSGNAESGKDVGQEARTIVSIQAEPGDYSKYLSNPLSVNAGTRILFELVAPYVSDPSVLDGAIAIEFSPEAAQVFAVCFSDRSEGFSYNSGSGKTSILQRQESTRRDLMLGYYCVNQLTEKIKGRSKENLDLILEIRNGNVLELVLQNADFANLSIDDTLKFVIYDGTDANNDEALDFSVTYGNLKNAARDSLEDAARNPLEDVEIKFEKGLFKDEDSMKFRFPVWKDREGIHIILDAADVQAGTSLYSKLKETSNNSDAKNAFKNTYSFYRFGLADDVQTIYASVNVTKGGTEAEPVYSTYKGLQSAEHLDGRIPYTDEPINGNSGYGESVAFASVSTDSSKNRTFELKNARHLYNMRYETEYKSADAPNNTFKLADNIDWNDFVGQNDSTNYFLNSVITTQGSSQKSGIDYDGNNYATTNDVQISLTGSTRYYQTETKNMPFPGFRCLGEGDTFTQDNAYGATDEEGNAKESFKISNLRITFAANVVYGVYDDVLSQSFTTDEEPLYSAKELKNDCLKNDFSGLLGLQFTDLTMINNKKNSGRSNLARGGAMPLGLFAENLGTISNITLDNHKVEGLQKLGNTERLVYTCMVGGFAGNNLNTMENLTLLCSTENATHVNGRTDVGGIVGRESFVLQSVSDTVNISGMKNYGNVTGMENVGGVVGRAYVNYVGDPSHDESFYTNYYKGKEDGQMTRYAMYHDGYFISDTNSSMTGKKVKRAKKVAIKDSFNYGKVSGDELLSEGIIDNTQELVKSDGVDPLGQDKFVGFPSYIPAVSDYSSVIQDAPCAFIGGIAGIMMDGLIIDEDKGTNSETLKRYGLGNVNYEPSVRIENCVSRVLYSRDMGKQANTLAAITRDSYVGGIVGYARLAQITVKDETAQPEGNERAFVFGNNYVGGIAGCSDLTKYGNGSEGSKENYNSINYNYVIGRRFVGGIAGAFGVGDYIQQTFSFRDPASNEGSVASQAYGDNKKYKIVCYLKNAGIALTLKSGDYPTGDCGGITGVVRQTIYGCDNIQPDSVKNDLCYFISNGTINSSNDINDLDKAISLVDNSIYGGNRVGGISGASLGSGNVNMGVIKTCSYVDAIVFGENCVGGGAGWLSTDSNDLWNILPKSGMLVLGKDSVGGIVGGLRNKYGYHTNNVTINEAYRVMGRYSVGGLFGSMTDSANVTEKNITVKANTPIDVKGKAYVGAVSGSFVKGNIYNNINISNMTMTGNRFAGGMFGVLSSENTNYPGSIKKVTTADSVNVYASEFAGGVAGGFFKINNGNSNSDLESIATALEEKTDKTLRINDVLANTNNSLFGVSTITGQIDFSGLNSHASVQSGIFAGGLFGLVPNGMNLTISGYRNMSRVRTSEYVDNISESSDKTVKYSYLGSVTGRVPAGVRLKNCLNTMNHESTDGWGQNYYSEQATYMGGLTEVNAGVIEGTTTLKKDDTGNDVPDQITYLVNTTEYNYPGKAFGAFAGVNNGLIQYCNNNVRITSGISAGIAATTGGPSTIRYCENHGEVTGSLVSAGILAGTMNGYPNGPDNPVFTINHCNNDASIIAAGDAGGIAGVLKGKAVVSNCMNTGTITASDNTSSAAGIVCRFESQNIGELQIVDCLNGQSERSNGIVQAGYKAAGILASVTTGGNVTLKRINNYGKIDRNASKQQGEEQQTATVYAAGIVAYAEGATIRIENNIESNSTTTIDTSNPAARNSGEIVGQNAAGIFGVAVNGTKKNSENVDETINPVISISNCVNTGTITPVDVTVNDNTVSGVGAGIAINLGGSTSNNEGQEVYSPTGSIEYCRNYGSITNRNQYGISAATTARLYGNLVYNGFYEQTHKDEEGNEIVDAHPIAPDDYFYVLQSSEGDDNSSTNSNHSRNFFIYGNATSITQIGEGRKERVETKIETGTLNEYVSQGNEAQISLGEDSIRCSTLYENANIFANWIEKIDSIPEPSYSVSADGWTVIMQVNSGDISEDAKTKLSAIHSKFTAAANSGINEQAEDEYKSFIKAIFCLYLSNVDASTIDPQVNKSVTINCTSFFNETIANYNADNIIVGEGWIADYSHWPVQLYAYESKKATQEDSTVKCKLVYKRWNSYFDSGIEEQNVTKNEDQEAHITEYFFANPALDNAFLAVVLNEENYPNESSREDMDTSKQGFVGNDGQEGIEPNSSETDSIESANPVVSYDVTGSPSITQNQAEQTNSVNDGKKASGKKSEKSEEGEDEQISGEEDQSLEEQVPSAGEDILSDEDLTNAGDESDEQLQSKEEQNDITLESNSEKSDAADASEEGSDSQDTSTNVEDASTGEADDDETNKNEISNIEDANVENQGNSIISDSGNEANEEKN